MWKKRFELDMSSIKCKHPERRAGILSGAPQCGVEGRGPQSKDAAMVGRPLRILRLRGENCIATPLRTLRSAEYGVVCRDAFLVERALRILRLRGENCIATPLRTLRSCAGYGACDDRR
jgi:hypothetical protein